MQVSDNFLKAKKMIYALHELQHAATTPLRLWAETSRQMFSSPFSLLAYLPHSSRVAAGSELLGRVVRRYEKPEFGLSHTRIDGADVAVTESVVASKPFCNLLHFARALPAGRKPAPRLLIVAPMSGDYATLLRGTVEAMMQHADVYITDWMDARTVPASDGSFDLDDYIDYVVEMLHELGEGAHVMAVCQPSVPVLAAVSVMEARGDRFAPASMILMGGPIDTTRSPTAVNDLAQQKGIDWFRENAIMRVPWPHQGFMREVYPGFLQLSGFMSMNLDRHIIAHKDFFLHLVKDDGDSAEKHRDFYDEYLAVMDLTAEFYLQTVETVFIDHHLPRGTMTHRGEQVDPGAIRNVAMLTVEGENDDITGGGQTEAAHDLCVNLPDSMKQHYTQPAVGHYGVFNGSRFRNNIVPRIVDFMAAHGRDAARPASRPEKKRA